MAAQIQCPNCGAHTSASALSCPYCRWAFTSIETEVSPSLSSLFDFYKAGNLNSALKTANLIEKQNPEFMKDGDFLLLYLKITIETDGSSFKMRNLITNGLLQPKLRSEFLLFSDIIDSIEYLNGPNPEPGVAKLKNVLSVDAKQPQALFLLGSYLFWKCGQPAEALIYLQNCVEIYPQFLRAWGCLAAVYENIKKTTFAIRAYQECEKLETEPQIKAFFKQHIEELANT